MTTVGTIAGSAELETVYRIGELASEFDVTLRTLRFYEDKGLIEPGRVGATRLYSPRDRARLKLILLGKRVGLSLHDISELLDLYEPDGDNRRQLERAQAKATEQLARLREERASIDAAIEELNDNLVELRARLARLG